MDYLPDKSVDLVCMDPPYYNNVQYAELSDYFYVWQKRTLGDLYPDLFRRRLTNKTDEAVANPARDGSTSRAAQEYERLMGEIFAECRRVLKDDGILTIMFTHKAHEAWEALMRSLIENGWIITSSVPVESEAAESIHQKDVAAAASSIFLTCRKRAVRTPEVPATWTGFAGSGVAQKVRDAVREGLKEFELLHLNPVDEMVASYGRALRVLSEHWPVLDGDELVSPTRAMNEASAVVAQYQISRLTGGRLRVDDLNPEAAMALTLYGIFGLADFPYDEALNLSRALNIVLAGAAGNYRVNGRMIGISEETGGRRSKESKPEESGYYAPLLRKGSRLRLALPEERSVKRLEAPQTEWDILQGLIMAFRDGDVPVARSYLERHAEGKQQVILDLLSVWAAKATDEKLRQEAEAMLFGLR
jgi:adenine-specific DNA methylase